MVVHLCFSGMIHISMKCDAESFFERIFAEISINRINITNISRIVNHYIFKFLFDVLFVFDLYFISGHKKIVMKFYFIWIFLSKR